MKASNLPYLTLPYLTLSKKFNFIVFTILFFSLASFAVYATGESTNPNISAKGFLKNAGQVYDLDGNSVPNVLYSLQLNGITAFITDKGITYGMVRYTALEKDIPFDKRKQMEHIKNIKLSEIARLDMNLLNATIKKENCVELEYSETLGVVNYYSNGLDASARDLKYCTKLKIKNIYPGIDWILLIDEEKGMKVDYEVHPGAKLSDIKFDFKGANDVTIPAHGKRINMQTPLESFSIGDLICYTDDNTECGSQLLFY